MKVVTWESIITRQGGNKGTFEYCAGSESAARYVKERLFEFPDTILNEKSTYLDVFDAYRKGDALATWAVHKVAWMLGYGIANIIYLINPDCIIIGPDYPDTKDFVNKKSGRLFEILYLHLWKKMLL